MNSFYETLAIVGAIGIVLTGTIMVLTLFFRGLSRISSSFVQPRKLAVLGILAPGDMVTVHLQQRRVLRRVRFLGTVDTNPQDTGFPYELHRLIILEDEQATRYSPDCDKT